MVPAASESCFAKNRCLRHTANGKLTMRSPHIPARRKAQIAPIHAELIRDNTATALGITAVSPSPLISLCKRLVAAGHDPASPLLALRGPILCLRVGSIGEAAGLEVDGHGCGFRPLRKGGAGPPVSAKPESGPDHPRHIAPGLVALIAADFDPPDTPPEQEFSPPELVT